MGKIIPLMTNHEKRLCYLQKFDELYQIVLKFEKYVSCSQFAIDVLTQLKPSVIFSAHDHKGMDYVGTKKTGKSNGTITFFSQQQVSKAYLACISHQPNSSILIVNFMYFSLTLAKNWWSYKETIMK